MQNKAALRSDSLQRRDRIPPEVRSVKNKLIAQNLHALEEVSLAGTIFFFVSFRSEVDTRGMIGSAFAAGKRVVLPKVDRTNVLLRLYEIRTLDELIPGYMGIPEPSVTDTDRLCSTNDVDAIIIPGACYDEKGNRVGYGGGYYDRLLARMQKPVPIIAPAYEEQIVDEVPAEPHDIRVGIIVTDRRVIRCGAEIGQDL
ncbi:MAG: 5-formyltetrahydrofolate cyclo-ligase [Nitrospiraceae bacterium]|nr:5-formyltetrahydrofolate cyclo-ligase [Nitrospiraceae bacterium]